MTRDNELNMNSVSLRYFMICRRIMFIHQGAINQFKGVLHLEDLALMQLNCVYFKS